MVSSMGAGSDFCWASCDVPGIGRSAAGVEFVHARDDAVEFLLQAIVGADVEIAAQQRIQRVVEILLGVVALAGLIVGQSGLVFLFGPGDQIGDWVGSEADGWDWSWELTSAEFWFLSWSILRLGHLGLRTRSRSGQAA